ncbi:MAG: CocE/NonD family hydrolase, partial [Anaerolineae bacterium]|nr:CocE/NonD family hydrolase [Anaerolineae bacterium]
MSTNSSPLYDVEVLYDIRIPMRDGLELSANLFRPVPRDADETFPAILEMIPYRKDSWRFASDHQLMTYLAQRGFVGCRLDVRGTGSSPGIALDEYTAIETQDGYDTVEWLAAQPWCNGRVGMWGISYGGFTSIQVAMLQPPSLKAIVPMYATDDRYTDDVHYIGGCLTASELSQYALSQVGMNALPPKAKYLQGDWAE